MTKTSPITPETSTAPAPKAATSSQARVVAPNEGVVAVFPEPKGKLATLANLIGREGGASIVELQVATGWQAHSVRGALAGALKKNHGLFAVSSKADGVRRYSLPIGKPRQLIDGECA